MSSQSPGVDELKFTTFYSSSSSAGIAALMMRKIRRLSTAVIFLPERRMTDPISFHSFSNSTSSLFIAATSGDIQ
ncbi:MAG: hypothetical protein ABSA18_16885 [Dehalococcoidia bacterium]